MSNFSKKLDMQMTGRYKLDQPPLSHMTVSCKHDHLPMERLTEYIIGVEFGLVAFVKDDVDDRVDVFKASREQLINELFGEFRMPIYRLREALYKREYAEASKLLDELYREMYS